MPKPEDLAHDSTTAAVSAPRDSFVRDLKPGRWLSKRFRIDGTLGAGGMGQVFRAFDVALDNPVALKVFGELSPESIAEIKREFRSAATLVHPNLVRLYELFCDGDEWFFTMDLVDGRTLSDALSDAPRDFELIRELFGQLAVALTALHRARTLHGDLKPNNVLVRTEDRRVVLVDFGLSQPLGRKQAGEVAGTPAYMAPEQAFGEALTEAADWYSYGVVLYEALTGELPRGYAPSSLFASAPEDLARLCKELLLLDPTARPRGEEVRSRLQAHSEEPAWSILPSVPPTATLIDRTEELGQLLTAFEDSLEQPRIALVRGPSGIGKTALIERFLDDARGRGVTVIAGKCRESESIAFKVVDGLLDDIAAFVGALHFDEAQTLLPDELSALTTVFPSLRRVEVIAERVDSVKASLDPGLIRQRAFAEFAQLLSSIRRQAPLVLWVDDLQWSDRESAGLLAPVLGGGVAVPLLFIASHRGEQDLEAPLLEALYEGEHRPPHPTIDVKLGPLPKEHSEALALSLLPAGQHERVDAIVRDAEGHPLFITELAHAASVDTGIGVDVSSLSELIKARVTALDRSARSVLEVSAIAGVPLSRSVLRRACGLQTAKLEEGLDVLRAARLATSRGTFPAGLVDVHHDRIRELVANDIQLERRRECHLRLATGMEAEEPSNSEFLAHHFEAAGEVNKASLLFVSAADRAMKALAFDHAANLYTRAERTLTLGLEERRRVTLRRAEALAYSGRGALAADAYLDAAKLAHARDVLEFERRAAEQLLLSGHLDRGISLIGRILQELGMAPPKSGRRLLPSVVIGRLLVRARRLRFRKRSEQEVSPRELAKIDASWTLACSLGSLDLLAGAEYQSRHLLLALRAGEPKRLLRALTLEVAFCATPGSRSEKRTSRLLHMAERLASEHASPSSEGLLQLSLGIASYLQGGTRQAVSHFEQALSIFDHERGAVWEAVTAHRFVIASCFLLGRFRHLATTVPALCREAESTGNVYAAMCYDAGYSTVAWLTLHRIEEAKSRLERTRKRWNLPGYKLSHYNLLVGETLLDCYTQDRRTAHQRLVQQWPLLTEARILAVAVLRVQLWFFRAATAAAAARQLAFNGDHSGARALRVEARHFAQRLGKEATKRAAPLADLVKAQLARDSDHPDAARYLARAAHSFAEQGLNLYAATAKLHLGRVQGGDEGAALVQSAATTFDEEGVVDRDSMLSALGAGLA